LPPGPDFGDDARANGKRLPEAKQFKDDHNNNHDSNDVKNGFIHVVSMGSNGQAGQ
jgi:hypothetical protein